jgi:hypothetical protein
MFDDVPRVAVDPAAIRGFTKDYEHGQVAFELFREATLCSVPLGSLMRADQPNGRFARLFPAVISSV